MTDTFIKNPQKVDLVTELHEFKSERGIHALHSLLDILIQEARQDNDIIQPAELPKNQGRIAAFQELQGYIENGVGIPEMKNYSGHGGSMPMAKIFMGKTASR